MKIVSDIVEIPQLSADAAAIVSGTIATARLGSGTANATTFLRGDQTWATTPVTVISLASNATVNGTQTGAKITGLDIATGVGTFVFRYHIRYQSAATTTGVEFAVNHTGTLSTFVATMMAAESTTAASTGAASQAGYSATTMRLMGASSARALATTVCNLGATISVDAADSDMFCVIEGLFIATVTGNLELWHASEVTANSTVMAGTSLILTKTA